MPLRSSVTRERWLRPMSTCWLALCRSRDPARPQGWSCCFAFLMLWPSAVVYVSLTLGAIELIIQTHAIRSMRATQNDWISRLHVPRLARRLSPSTCAPPPIGQRVSAVSFLQTATPPHRGPLRCCTDTQAASMSTLRAITLPHVAHLVVPAR